MESWRLIWRNGFAPVLSTIGLTALQKALKRNDPRVLQGATTAPAALNANRYVPLQGACALGYCGWRDGEIQRVGEADRYFAELCAEADSRLGEPTACRWFLSWYDETPREEMRRELLNEVTRTLKERFPQTPTKTGRLAA